MTSKQIECFRNLLYDFEENNDYKPTGHEWEEYVSENISGATEGFDGMTEASILRLARTAYEELDTVDSMRSELDVKARDSESNLNNRKYNFGNF